MKNRNRFILLLIAWLVPLAMVAQTNHWTPQSAGYEDNMTLTGVIQINGVEQESTTLEVGAFCGSECRGSARPVLFPATGRYLVFLTLYGNDGDQITFKLYDHSQGAELNLQSPAAITFGPNGLGSLINPYVLNFTAYNYTITASASPSNGGTISGAGTYPSGSTCTLTATPATGYSFVRWTKNGSQVSTNPSYSFTVTGNASYVAVFSLNSYTISASSSPSAGGSVSGAGSYNYGSTCTLTATPATGYSFVRWTKNGSQVSTNPSYSFTVTGNASYVAVFSLNSYTISASSSPSAGGSVSGAGSYNYGSTCTLTATPATGYSFVRWTKNGSQVSTNASYSFTVTENASYVAVFSLNSYTISVSANPTAGGSVSGGGTYNYGSTCTLTASANTGYTFTNWTKNGTVVSTSASYSFTVTGGGTYVANFSLNSYTISVSANPSAGGTVSGGGTYNYGSTCTLTASANTGYNFVRWTKNGSQVSTNANYSFTVTENASYVAEFNEVEDYIVFVDPNVKAICIANWDTNGSGELSYAEAAAVTSLGDVFSGDTTITSFEELQYFTGLSEIGAYAFHNCSNLTGSLNIPNSVTSIRDFAFYGCSGFTGSLTIPNTVTSIGFNAFGGCSGFTGTLTISASVTSIGFSAFYGCSGFTGSLTIPNSVTSIGTYAFSGCSGFTGTLTLPNSITSIGGFIFRGCSGFTGSLTIPNSVTSIESSAFDGCSGFTGTLTIPESVTSIGSYAFCNCSGFTGSLTIPNSVTSIGDNAFYYCSGFMGTLTIPSSVTSIGRSAFCGCSGFTGTLTIPNSIISIGEFVFKNCSSFTGTLTIPNSVTSIGYCAFIGCSGFTGTLTIPDSVTSIGDYAFQGCSGFTSMIILPEAPPTLGSNVFYGIPKSIPVNVPCASIASYQAATGWSEFTNYHGIGCLNYEITTIVNPAEGGTVNGGGIYEEGTECTLIATANEGYNFINWSENGEVVSTEATYSFTVTGDRNLVANFMEGDVCGISFNLNDSWGDGWNGNYLVVSYGDISEQLTIENGSTASYNLVIPDGSHVTLSWISGSWIGECSYTISYDNGNVIYYGSNMSSSFSYGFDVDCDGMPATIFNIMATVSPVEGGSVIGGGGYTYGQTCTMTAAANEGYTFMYWTENGSQVSSDANYSFMVSSSRNLVAHFALPFTVTTSVNSAENGIVSFNTDFENQQIPSSWINDISYPWVITTPEYAGYNGSFCMMSGNGGVHSSTSSIEVSVDFIEDGTISFLAGCWGEGGDGSNWDKCRFYIDGVMQMDYGAHQSWESVSFDVTVGNHTFTWTYKKDGSVHPAGDAFFVDDVKFTGASISSQFNYGQTCIMTATPMEEYQFYCWKENGNVVSTDANYSFTVTSDRNLVGVFGLSLSVSVTSNLCIGGTVSGGGVFDYGATCTVTATPNEGYLFLNWNRNGEIVSCNANYSFAVTEPVALEAVFMPLNGRLVGVGEATNQYLPSYSYYYYTLSQQIYTPDEIGAAGSILTISYFNAGETKTRSYDIYMVHTDKNTFESNMDWITVTEADRVFSGEVTMTKGYWNTILLDTSFDYDGTSNLAIIVDDNSGNWSSNHMYCRVFNANGSQAIRVYSDGTNYDPYNPSGYGGTLHSVKNQMILGVMPAYHFVTAGTWGNAANWSGGALPGAGDAVFIDANCALNRDAEVALLSVTPGQVLTLRPGKTLSVTGNLFNTDIEGLVVEDGAQLVNTSYNVAATVKKNVQAYNNSNPDGWYTISSPMIGMVIEGSNFLTPCYDLYRFNETNLTHDEWENYKVNLADFTTFEKGRGYLYANSNTFAPAFTGILNNLDITYTLTCTERPNDPLSGFNLIGNPFPHEIYKGAGGAINNVNLASGYYTLTNEGTWEVHSFDDAIQPGQGFLVKATAPTVLTIAKSNEVAFSESGDAKKGATERMCISVAGDNGQDRTYVYFGQGVGLDKKNDFDAQVPNLWIRDNGHDYAIAHVEDTDESLELCFSNRLEGDFTLAITTSDMEFEYLQLIDRAAGVTVDLLKQSVYTFHSERNEGTKRFTLAFKKK